MNIVGSNALVRLPNVDIDERNTIFEINVTGTLRGIQTCAPLIRESGGGSIVNIGSVAGITGNFSTGYSSSKWALEGLSRSAAYVYADWGIRCNVIQPGFIETDLTASMSSNVKRMASRAMNNTVLLRGTARQKRSPLRPCSSPAKSLPTSLAPTLWSMVGGFPQRPTSQTSAPTTCSNC